MSSNPNSLDINYLRILFAEGSDGFLQDYKKLADFFPALVFVLDADKKTLAYTNKQFGSLLGYTHDDLSGLENDWTRIVFQDDISQFEEDLKKCYDLPDEES